MCIEAVCSIWFRQYMFEVKEFGWKIDPPCGCGQAETGGLGHVTPCPVSIYVQSMVEECDFALKITAMGKKTV